MKELEIFVVSGVLVLFFIINTTMVFSISSEVFGKKGAGGDPSASGLRQDTLIPEISRSQYLSAVSYPESIIKDTSDETKVNGGYPVQVSSTGPEFFPAGYPGSSVTESPGSNLSFESGPAFTLIESELPDTPEGGSEAPEMTQDSVLKPDIPAAAYPALPRIYVTIVPPEPVKREQRPTIQAEIPRISREGYIQIYALRNQYLSEGTPHVYFNLINPPLIIYYEVSPDYLNDLKYVEYLEGHTLHAETINVSRPFEQTWASVIVRNKATDTIVAEDGYGRIYGLQSERQLVIRQCGEYEFEFNGEFASINLTMEAKRDGNIPGFQVLP